MTTAILHFTSPFESSFDPSPLAALVGPFLTALGAKPKPPVTRTILRTTRGGFVSRTLELVIELQVDLEQAPEHLADVMQMLKKTVRRAGRGEIDVAAFVVLETPS